MVDLGAQRAHHAELGAAEGQQARKAETRGKKAAMLQRKLAAAEKTLADFKAGGKDPKLIAEQEKKVERLKHDHLEAVHESSKLEAGVSSKTTRRKGGEKEATAQPAQKDLKKKNSTEMAIEDVPPEPGKTEGHEYVFEPVEYEEEVDLSGKLPQSCSV